MSAVPANPATPQANGPVEFRTWTDNAIRYVPYVPSPEEDQALIDIALKQQPVKQTLQYSQLLLNRAADQPDRLFLPLVWVVEELNEGQTPQTPQDNDD